mgnify:CR=1 FL=1
MSCKKCEIEQEDNTEWGAFYRWKNANVEIRGCDEHLREIFDTLNKVQNERINSK